MNAQSITINAALFVALAAAGCAEPSGYDRLGLDDGFGDDDCNLPGDVHGLIDTCGGDGQPDQDPFDAPSIPWSLGLEEAGNCADAEARLDASLVSYMETGLLARLHDFYARKAKPEWQCCEPSGSDADTDADTDGDTDSDSDWEEDDSADEYSETNNQVAGVDEPDFIKNDGSYIYIIADGLFQIVDAWPAADAHRISTTEIEGEPKKLFVHADRAVVYSSLDLIATSDPVFAQAQSADECTYGYDCDFVGDGRELKITVLDISDPSSPTLLREDWFDGSYVNARRIGDTVFTVAAFPSPLYDAGNPLNGVSWIPSALQPYLGQYTCGCEIPFTLEEITGMFVELFEQNLAAMAAYSYSVSFPGIEEKVEGDDGFTDANVLEDCPNFFLSNMGDGYGFITISAFDVTAGDPLESTTVMGRPGAVYANAESLYLANRHYASGTDWWFEEIDVNEATALHKFALDPAAATVSYTGSGVTKGRVLNQFAMDEHDGFLRVASTTGHVPDPAVHSTLTILAEQDGALEVVGMVDDIAPTEDIRSVRFKDELGFVVTFKKTDPLFVIALEDPQNPEILGELKIPGYSTYMHVMDDEHLLTIGYDAEDMDSFAFFQGIQLQIIDYSDLTAPALDHKLVIGTRGSASEAATDHMAFNYFASRDQLALPMVICEESDGGGNYGEEMTFSGLQVYDVTAEDGFELLGGVAHDEPGNPWDEEDDWDYACYGWWSSAGSHVKRSVFMENFVYSVAPDEIRIADVDDAVALINLVDLTAPTE